VIVGVGSPSRICGYPGMGSEAIRTTG
jgi:hypothetical protein